MDAYILLEMIVMEGSEKKFTLEELKQYDGKDGRPAYIAYKGKDLTEKMAQAPHGEETLERVKPVGILVS